jgi:hypothetical protein
MSAPNGSPFKVVMSGQVRQGLKAFHARAKQKGQGTSVLSAVKRIVSILGREPFAFGEPRFTLAELNLEVRVGAVPPVLVIYGVHKDRRIVFLRDLLPLPGADF